MAAAFELVKPAALRAGETIGIAAPGGEAREWALGEANGMRGLAAGVAQGRLYGGCLSLLAASLGTKYAIETAGRILFLEDVAEKPYRIDRMLMQLGLAGKLKDV